MSRLRKCCACNRWECACFGLFKGETEDGPDAEIASLTARTHELKAELDAVARALHPHKHPDDRFTYQPNQLPEMVDRLTARVGELMQGEIQSQIRVAKGLTIALKCNAEVPTVMPEFRESWEAYKQELAARDASMKREGAAEALETLAKWGRDNLQGSIDYEARSRFNWLASLCELRAAQLRAAKEGSNA